MFTVLFYSIILLNSAFLVALFFFFRNYIQKELKKSEPIRHIERELEEFVLSMNQSAEQITQVIESKIQQLQQLLGEVKQKRHKEAEPSAEDALHQELNKQQQELQGELENKL